jgi:predicted RND superfamily exporter protein
MIGKIEVNGQLLKYFDKSIEFRLDTEFIINNLSGIDIAEYSVPAIGENGINDPKYLQNLEKFSNWLNIQPEVDHVLSISDIFKRLNKNMHNNDESWYKIPDSKELAAQYLLFYELSLPYGLDLTDRINIDKSASRLSVTLKDLSTNQILTFKQKSDNWIKENLPSYMESGATGPAIMFSFISKRNTDAMLYGNLFALIVISSIIMIALKSIKIGLISLIPNLIPVALGFGIWAILIGQINMAASFAFAVCLGIIVDDTIHFLSKYLRAKRENGFDARQAVRYTFNNVGVALLVTTIILVGGFMVLAQSDFKVNSYLGMLCAIIIGCALVADFILLPSLLIWIDDLTKKLKKNT